MLINEDLGEKRASAKTIINYIKSIILGQKITLL